jgi:hypothetical protein
VFLNQCLVFRTVWEGSYNQTFSITRRLETNILMKRKIYPLVHLKYRSYLPKLVDVDRYLRLHWGLVAIHSGHPWIGLRTMLSACTSRPAWSLLARSLVFRQNPWLVNKTHLAATAVHPTMLTDECLDVSDFTASFAVHHATNLSTHHRSWSLANSPLTSDPLLHTPSLKSPPTRPIESEPEPLTSDRPDLKFRDLRNRIRLRSLLRALLSGNVRFVAHLLISFCAEYGQHGLAKLYPATPPVTKIPIASSSQHHSYITVSILKRIRYRDNAVNQPLHVASVRRYLRLRWAIAAFRQGYWLAGMQVAFPAIVSIRAWKHWLKLIQLKQLQTQEQAIHQMFLQVHRPLSSSSDRAE